MQYVFVKKNYISGTYKRHVWTHTRSQHFIRTTPKMYSYRGKMYDCMSATTVTREKIKNKWRASNWVKVANSHPSWFFGDCVPVNIIASHILSPNIYYKYR